MYKHITKDYLSGLFDSIRFDKFIKILSNDTKIFKSFKKITKLNFAMYLFPQIIISLIYYIFDLDFSILLYWLSFPLGIISCFFHILQYIDIISSIKKYSSKFSSSTNNMNYLTLSITMIIYQFFILSTLILINFVGIDILFFKICLKIIILSTYHSFYFFNNLWQYKCVTLYHRIDIHEKLWPYYLGFGTISSILYIFTDTYWFIFLYNLYTSILICLPFIIKTKYPPFPVNYPSGNLKFIFYVIKYFVNFIKNLSIDID
ncbi:putative membrane protein [Moumouvirus maliensis]|nr:putative membrane protein [Moumouvirus maliensis]